MDEPPPPSAAPGRRLRPLEALGGSLTRLVEGRLWLQVLLGMFAGLLVGVAIGPSTGWVADDVGVVIGNWLAFPGRLFLLTIQMIVVPLVFASIIGGLTGGGSSGGELKRIALWVVGFFVVSTAIAAAIGIQLALWIEPGAWLDMALPDSASAPTPVALDGVSIGTLPEMMLGVLPHNPLNAMVEGQMLQVVLFGCVVAVALLSLPKATARPLLDLLRAVQEVCMTVVRWAMRIAPLAVFGLMAQLTSRTGFDTLFGLGVYVLTVFAGLAIVLVAYLVLLRVMTGTPVMHFLRGSRELLLLAFSTSSSAAVMPLSMRTAVETLGIRRRVAEFVIPLGATINMNGTALYQAVAAVFLAQVFGVDVSTGGLVLVVAMAVGASIGSPATPGVGIVILATIVSGIGVPPAGVALIMGVDRILDMSRTAVNVAGDLVTCTLVDRWLLGDAPRGTG